MKTISAALAAVICLGVGCSARQPEQKVIHGDRTPAIVDILEEDSNNITEADIRIAEASWYGPGFHGRKMANGRRFNQWDPTTVAHKSLPLGTEILATNPDNGQTIVCVVRDRGPYVEDRELDFSRAAAEKLGFRHEGVAHIVYQVLSYPPGKHPRRQDL